MSDPFIGEIKMFAGNYAPYDYAMCSGQIMLIKQSTVLFSVIGDSFGGDGKDTFALPNLGGLAPIGQGQAPGAVLHDFADQGGQETALIDTFNMPNHNHPVGTSLSNGITNIPASNTFLAAAADAAGSPINIYGDVQQTPPNVAMFPPSVAVDGGGKAFSTRNPYLAVTFIIALNGVFPNKPTA